MKKNPATKQCAAWSDVLTSIKTELSEQSFKTWFECITCVSCSSDAAVLLVPDKFYAEWLEDHYKEIVRSAFYKVIGTKPQIKYEVSKTEHSKNSMFNAVADLKNKDDIAENIRASAPQASSTGLNETYTF
ncbi:MAG: hypothetical protein JW938_00650, partial [Candidatus Omnitrophica bacterium]|nr:hypothetical protein [Candidatus Omnitrophota bacterium]